MLWILRWLHKISNRLDIKCLLFLLGKEEDISKNAPTQHFFRNFMSSNPRTSLKLSLDGSVYRPIQHLRTKPFSYRVSHDTWQLVNSFECRLPYTVLDIKGFLAVYFVKKIFCSNILDFEINFTIIWLLYNIFIIVFPIKQLKKFWKKTF